jgi:rhodanese-related sulfurtransferase
LVPNQAVRLVLCDGGDGIAERAARRAQAMGYGNVHILAGGAPAWQRAGYTLYAGVNVPSKTFGELIEHERHTPRVMARDLQAMREAAENFVIVDGRPLGEYAKMSIPGGICCPNGELALRIGDLVPDPTTKIVVNCAGRTRSIIGAQTLIDFGIPNPVYALENGTQGWFLAGLTLEHGASRRYADTAADGADAAALETRARRLAGAHKVEFVAAAQANAWLADAARTTYLLDVRTPEEFAAHAVPGFVHAPGGQLIQATDQWVGVRSARLVLADAEQVRAPVVAAWLRQLGHEAYVLEGGITAAAKLAWQQPRPAAAPGPLRAMAPAELAEALSKEQIEIIDLRPSMAYRKGHIQGAVWSIRPRIAAVADRSKAVVLIADDASVAALAAVDLGEVGCDEIRLLDGGPQEWRAASLPLVATPEHPPDAERIDFLFFTAARHDGDAEAARAYLAWETSLIAQLDAQERGAFRIA